MAVEVFEESLAKWRRRERITPIQEAKIAAVKRTGRAQARLTNFIQTNGRREAKAWLANLKARARLAAKNPANNPAGAIIPASGPDISTALSGGFFEAWKAGTRDSRTLINKAAKNLDDEVIPQAALSFEKSYMPELAGVYADDVLEEVSKLTYEALAQGLSESQAAFYLRQLPNIVSEFMDWRLECIARTEAIRAYNLGNLYDSLQADEVAGYQFSAVLDSRTTEICERRNGLFFKKDDIRLAWNTPPLHPNCRSVLIPIFMQELDGEEWQEDERIEKDLPSSIQRQADISAVLSIFAAATQY